MPTPQAGEGKDEFIERCIPIVLDDGTAEDEQQAYAVCLSMWETEKEEKSAMEVERRYVPSEFRVEDDGSIEGYAAVFGVWSEPLGWFKEKIRKGAFTNTLKSADVRALFNHDPNYVIGRNKSGTLELAEDDHGLHFRATPPDTQWANDLRSSMKRGDINQGSFGFKAVEDEWDNKNDTRELIEVELFDVSVVTYPAYPQTSISARALENLFIGRLRSRDAEPELIRAIIGQLEQLVEAEDGPEPGQEEERGPQVRLARLKRQLDLRERKVI